MGQMQVHARRTVRAICLLSGGLDSQLSVCDLRDQNIEVHAVTFDSPFFHPAQGRRAAEALGVPLHVIDFTTDIVDLLRDPPHGFGSCLNPCIDCHARMLRRTGELMTDLGADVLATGEVLDQRPMSQNRDSLATVARESGYGDVVLRPLSARLLEPTRPEREGKVDRARLLDLQGRGRKRQMELAASYGLTDYPTPAGGCRLTEPNFCKRLRDLIDHEGMAGVRALALLRYGRHFRLGDRVKAIVGRNERDNTWLEGGAELYDLVLKVEDIPGPVVLLPYTADEDQIRTAAAICARYSDCESDAEVTVKIRSARDIRKIAARPARDADIEHLRL